VCVCRYQRNWGTHMSKPHICNDSKVVGFDDFDRSHLCQPPCIVSAEKKKEMFNPEVSKRDFSTQSSFYSHFGLNPESCFF